MIATFPPSTTLSATVTGTTPAPIGDWDDNCQPAQDNGSEYSDPNWGKRDRIDAHKGQRAKAIKRNRKAAKAARKSRKR